MVASEASHPAGAAPVVAHGAEDRAMARWIGRVLRGGVVTAAAIVLAGVGLFLFKGPGPGDPRSRRDLTAGGGHPIAVHLGAIARNAGPHHPFDLVRVGLLVLILTPLLRVAMTCALFVAQRDWVFVAITAVVLAVLVVGLIGVGA